GLLPLSPSGLIFKYQTDVRQYAMFGESRLAFSDHLTLVTGLRHDRPEVERDDALDPAMSYVTTYPSTSWRAGIVYNPDRLSLYAQYSAAADPVTNVLGADIVLSEFEMSTGKQWEAGAKMRLLQGRGEFAVSAYHIVKNKILTRSEDDPTVSVQVGEQSSYGLEASFGLEVAEGLSL